MKFQNELDAIHVSSNDSLLYGSEPFPDGILCQVGNCVQVKLFHDLPAVGFNGFYADIKVRGNLFC